MTIRFFINTVVALLVCLNLASFSNATENNDATNYETADLSSTDSTMPSTYNTEDDSEEESEEEESSDDISTDSTEEEYSY